MMNPSDIGKISRKLIKPDLIQQELTRPAPTTAIANKPSILFLGLNPAGDAEDARRENNSGGMYLYYYPELDPLLNVNPSWFAKRNTCNYRAFIYKDYYDPIRLFFQDVTGHPIAWEWCNFNIDDVISSISRVRNNITSKETKLLRECHEKYKKHAQYQIIVRDLVYYHQTNGLDRILKSKDDMSVRKVIKDLLDEYICIFSNDDLKLIFVSFATTCHYVESALIQKPGSMEDFGGLFYKGIPIVFAGRALSGQGVIDDYSRVRLKTIVKTLL